MRSPRDPASLSDDELDEVVVGLQQTQSMLAALTARLTGEWERRRVWAADGARSAAAQLAQRANTSRTCVNRDLARARRLRHMPLIADAFAAGEIDAERVDVLGRANIAELRQLFLRDERTLLDAARHCEWDDFLRVVWCWKEAAEDEVGRNPTARRWTDRRLSIGRGFDGTVDVLGHGPAIEGAIIEGEIDRLERLLFAADLAEARNAHGDDVALSKLARTAQQRRFDALVEMARRSASLPEGADLARPLFTVVIDHPTFAGICELSSTLQAVSPSELVRHLGDFDVERIVFGPVSRVLDVGRRTRVFRGALARAIKVRDRHCQLHPSCRVPAERCQVDHVIEFEDGGETTDANGQPGCGPHNRWKHAEKRKRQGRPPPRT